uniref:Integrase family protein n=1 Tax=uncultured bacterium scaffold00056 TaxID=1132475 RepID=I6ZMD0_9BACT|nr:integrase family protein [uncultured bacterium scaffold00056]
MRLQEAPLKTKNSCRHLSVSRELAGILRAKQLREENRTEYVFSSPGGGPISPDSVRHMLHRVLERAGMEKIRYHDLRHTFATLAIQNGVDIKTVSQMLGHYSAGFTLDTYAHVTTAMQRDAAAKVGSFLQGKI